MTIPNNYPICFQLSSFHYYNDWLTICSSGVGVYKI